MKTRTITSLTATAAACLALSACGGGAVPQSGSSAQGTAQSSTDTANDCQMIVSESVALTQAFRETTTTGTSVEGTRQMATGLVEVGDKLHTGEVKKEWDLYADSFRKIVSFEYPTTLDEASTTKAASDMEELTLEFSAATAELSQLCPEFATLVNQGLQSTETIGN